MGMVSITTMNSRLSIASRVFFGLGRVRGRFTPFTTHALKLQARVGAGIVESQTELLTTSRASL